MGKFRFVENSLILMKIKVLNMIISFHFFLFLCSDRSWARRARGGGRLRPDLLNADFSGDRERAASPSPSPIPSTPEEDNKPK